MRGWLAGKGSSWDGRGNFELWIRWKNLIFLSQVSRQEERKPLLSPRTVRLDACHSSSSFSFLEDNKNETESVWKEGRLKCFRSSNKHRTSKKESRRKEICWWGNMRPYWLLFTCLNGIVKWHEGIWGTNEWRSQRRISSLLNQCSSEAFWLSPWSEIVMITESSLRNVFVAQKLFFCR